MNADKAMCPGRNRSGAPCRNEAGKGTSHPGVGLCKHHTGSTPNGEKHAARLIATQLAAVADTPTTPDEVLNDQLVYQAHLVHVLRRWLGEINQADATAPVGNPDHRMRFEPHVIARWRGEEEDRLTRIAKVCGDAGLADRALRVAEVQGDQLAAFARRFVQALGMGLEDTRVRDALRLALTAGAIDTTATEEAA